MANSTALVQKLKLDKWIIEKDQGLNPLSSTQRIFSKGAKPYIGEHILSNKWCWKSLRCGKMKLDPHLILCTKQY